MRDGFEEAVVETPRPKLSYPFERGPESGEALDIAGGVKWLRMPLGGSLAFINVWAIAEDDGWVIVDTGMGGPDTMDAWRKAFAGSLKGKPVGKLLLLVQGLGLALEINGWPDEAPNARFGTPTLVLGPPHEDTAP